MRRWFINMTPGGELHVQLISLETQHVVSLLVDSGLQASEVGSVLAHMEAAAIEHDSSAPAQRLGSHGTLKGSLSVTAADGADITQPSAAAE